MTFQHNFLPREELESTTNGAGRKYITPIGPLPSVTTVIGQAMDKSYLEKWREKIGEEEAEAIRFQAGGRGHEIHDLCEAYVMNKPQYANGYMPINIETFRKIKPIIDENLEIVYGIELPLWSKVLKTAGTADLIAKWGRERAVVDYKTSLKPKIERDCLGYMLQGTAYAYMMYERYQMFIPNVVVILAVDHEPKPIVYDVSTSKYLDEVVEIFRNRSQDEIVQSIPDRRISPSKSL